MDTEVACFLQAKHAINELYTRVLAERALASNVLILFDHTINRYELDPVDAASCTATVNTIGVGGGTSFTEALTGIQYLMANP